MEFKRSRKWVCHLIRWYGSILPNHTTDIKDIACIIHKQSVRLGLENRVPDMKVLTVLRNPEDVLTRLVTRRMSVQRQRRSKVI